MERIRENNKHQKASSPSDNVRPTHFVDEMIIAVDGGTSSKQLFFFSAIDLAGNSLLQQLLTAPAGLCQNDVSAWVAPAIFRFATDSRDQPFL